MISTSNDQFNNLRDLTKFKNCQTPKALNPKNYKFQFLTIIYDPKTMVDHNISPNKNRLKLNKRKNTEPEVKNNMLLDSLPVSTENIKIQN